MAQACGQYYKRDFWMQENLNYAEPHFRLEKVARLINTMAGTQECELLDIGCGPATLMPLLHRNIHYHGIDIAIHNPAPNLVQTDFLENEIKFNDKLFDIVLAQGVFEYVGRFQSQKFAEIRRLLRPRGRFVTSYVNFDHVHRFEYPVYNNIQSTAAFKESLQHDFHIDRFFATSHNWHHHDPNRRWLKTLQMRLNINVPIISPRLAIQYIFICSARA